MKLERGLEILDLKTGASTDEAKQAYKDLVTVWHPDRIPDNPRLKQKAQEKLKEINVAYEVVFPFLSSSKRNREAEKDQGAREGFPNKAEVVAEAGTRLILSTCYHIYGALRRIAFAVAPETSHDSGHSALHRGKETKGPEERAGVGKSN